MPHTKLILKPGIDRQRTQTLNTGGWYDSSLVRFRDGLPQKFFGWQKAIATALGAVCRGIHVWQQLDGEADVAFGLTNRIDILQGGVLNDVTPLDTGGTLGANPFLSGAIGSATVTVHHVSHGRNPGDIVQFEGSTVFDGITIDTGTAYAEYIVQTSADADHYTITANQTAVAGAVTGGGAAVLFRYYMPSGSTDAIFGAGWGAGVWGGTNPARGWGTASSSTIRTQGPRIVTMDNWGEDLIFSPRGGAIYQWDATTGVGARAVQLTANDAPTLCNAILIGLPERHLIAYGANNPLTGAAFDPLLVRWSDVESYNVNGNWTATEINTAGSFRLQGGTQLIYAQRTQGGILVLTDDTCYLQSFIGGTLVYSFRPQGSGAGLVAVNAIVEANGTVEWMGSTGFFSWRGALRKLESTLHNDIFGSGSTGLLRTQAEKVFAGLNSSANEIIYFYPSNGGGGECDRYVVHNISEDLWYGGALARTCWVDRGIFANPIAVDPATGSIFYHEIGVDNDTAAMSVYIESGYVDLSGGAEVLYIDRIIPDFADFTGSVQITFKGQMYPNGPITTKGPYTVLPGTEFVRSPIRARQVAIRIASSTVGDWWRLGGVRLQSQSDGVIY